MHNNGGRSARRTEQSCGGATGTFLSEARSGRHAVHTLPTVMLGARSTVESPTLLPFIRPPSPPPLMGYLTGSDGLCLSRICGEVSVSPSVGQRQDEAQPATPLSSSSAGQSVFHSSDAESNSADAERPIEPISSDSDPFNKEYEQTLLPDTRSSNEVTVVLRAPTVFCGTPISDRSALLGWPSSPFNCSPRFLSLPLSRLP
jgi:hypothetical protein